MSPTFRWLEPTLQRPPVTYCWAETLRLTVPDPPQLCHWVYFRSIAFAGQITERVSVMPVIM